MVTVRDTHSEMTGPKCEPFSMDQLVMFGDSITQFAWQAGGMGSELANYYQRRLYVFLVIYTPIHPPCLSGASFRTAGLGSIISRLTLEIWPLMQLPGLSMLPKRVFVLENNADISGTWHSALAQKTNRDDLVRGNDAVIPPKPQMVTPENFVKNMIELIEIVQKHASPSGGQQDGSQLLIVLITPPPISIALRAADLTSRFPDWRPQDMDREPGRTRLFAELVCQVAQEKGLPVIDTWTAITKAADNSQGGLSTYLVDGLHLTPAGYAIVTTEFKSIVARHYPTFLPESLPHDFPWWAEIDVEHPENSFPSPASLLLPA
ncbi:hypothetical protein H4Q26_015355 [Puccinia striiformis f. sp. tritici PST-130]|nr:hypothetical protein H4Q26_015355 [Puccinia striiformis f. sp. tritici PST-130]